MHPKVQAAIAAQLQRFTHTCYQVVPYAEYVSLAERINAIVPINWPRQNRFLLDRGGSGRERHQDCPLATPSAAA